jgi:hypothetical protein
METGLSPGSNSVVEVVGATPLLGPEEDDTMCGANTDGSHLNHMANGCASSSGHIGRSKSFKERLDPLLCEYRMLYLHVSVISRLIFMVMTQFILGPWSSESTQL